ncbi:MAG: High-affinity branched-chain amino acid transport ATP-binding protein LivF [Paracidovorax wautersii]|uniref:High-affinity branched-chain amino acid transport ATP-binding protein LivF n=1 Tax=Paracidovorax wautersii TaxID=1177982 RepID=A0A7V8FPD9_9BURK|nr:MAG: High-affinity branched-chain amino acid transport ATP-binding protein LivF [Paracidovorax wautersii]
MSARVLPQEAGAGGELRLENIVAGYGARAVLHGVSLAVPAGGSLVVVGPNGSGKSTLMRVVSGLLRPQTGRVLWCGRDVTALDAPARARLGLGYVPQEANVFRNLSVHDNLKLGHEFTARRGGQGLAARLAAVLALFPEIEPKLGTLAGHLSGGQRQMVAMAAALMPAPALLALDEPSAGLSPRNAERLFEVVSRVARAGVTLFMIEQNTRLGLGAAHQGAVLVAGQVCAQAPSTELLADGQLQRLYLGAR